MKPCSTNKVNLNLSDEELFNTFDAVESQTTANVGGILCPTAIENDDDVDDNVESISSTSPIATSNASCSTPPSILKQTDCKIKLSNKQNSKSFVPYSSPISTFGAFKNVYKNRTNGHNSGDYLNSNGTIIKKEKLTLVVDDTHFFVSSDLFNLNPSTYLGQ
jgi:hypothetical protein